MSANAKTWFHQEPKHQPYLIAERLNSTFWQARIFDICWQWVQQTGTTDTYICEKLRLS